MINNLTKIEIKIGERVYQLLCEPNSPLGEVHDALTQIKAYIIQRMEEVDNPPIKEELPSE